MADSLRDQLLKSGLVKQTRNKPAAARPPRRKPRPPKAEGEPDLARAYAMRAKEEARDRREAQARAEAEARARKERKRRLQEALDGHTLNKPEAEQLRHFEYGGKIRRVHVDDGQMAQLNRGELGVVQVQGRYLLVTRQLAEQIRAFAPEHVALLVDPDAAVADDGVPDDLIW